MSEGELPTVEGPFFGPHLSNLETGVTPVAEGIITNSDTQCYGENAGDSGDDVIRSAQPLEYGNGCGGGGCDDDDNNATVIGLQVLKQRKCARSLSVDTTTRRFETPDHDTDRLLDGSHLAKRQRLSHGRYHFSSLRLQLP